MSYLCLNVDTFLPGSSYQQFFSSCEQQKLRVAQGICLSGDMQKPLSHCIYVHPQAHRTGNLQHKNQRAGIITSLSGTTLGVELGVGN